MHTAEIRQTRPVALSIREVSKHFGVVHAVNSVSLNIRGGSVMALLGENGAGKSTLIGIASGAVTPTSGTLAVRGRVVKFSGPLDAARCGVQVVHQAPQLADELSIAENIFLGRLAESRAWAHSSRRALESDARGLLNRLGLTDHLPDVRRPASRLSAAGRQLVAIAKAMATDASIVFLDEPNSSLTPRETAILWDIVRHLRDHDVAVVVVSHRLKELYEIVDEVAILRDGHLVGSGPAEKITLEDAVRLMAGRAPRQRATRATPVPGAELLRLEDVSTESLRGVSLSVRAGEVVGLAGLVGSGRTEIGRAMCGADAVVSGGLFLNGRPVRFRTVRAAARAGVMMTSEERRRAVFASHTVRFNAVASVLDRSHRWGFMLRSREKQAANDVIRRLGVRGQQPDSITALSGGNQQKVMIGRTLAAAPKVLILDEPTHGIDVNTKREIGQVVRDLARADLGIVFISSEVEELLDVADRILVVRHGQIVREVTGEDALTVVAAALGESTITGTPSKEVS
jgi:ABC-type sugar transport system ATPase subunit